jgi:hypothetical protein
MLQLFRQADPAGTEVAEPFPDCPQNLGGRLFRQRPEFVTRQAGRVSRAGQGLTAGFQEEATRSIPEHFTGES